MRPKIFHRALSSLLAIILFVITPLSDYSGACSSWASLVASESDAEEIPEIEGEYMPDNIVTRYEQSFIDYPDTLIGSTRARFALADDVIIILTALFAALGIYFANTVDLTAFVEQFEIWLRQAYGNAPAIMQTWQAILNPVDTVKITGLKVFLPVVWKYLKTAMSGYGTVSPDYSFSTGSYVIKDGPFHPDMIKTMDEYGSHRYLASFPLMDNSNVVYDSFCTLTVMDKPMIAFYVSTGGLLSIVFIDDRDKISFNNPHFYSRTYVPSDLSYKYSNGAIFSYNSNCYKPFLSNVDYSLDDRMQFMANCLPYPLFKDMDYARSYAQYGTMDGIVLPDPDYVFKPANAWTDLQQGALDRFGDTLTIPSPEAWHEIQNRLESSVTADEALSALGTIFEINSSGGTVSTRPFVDLSYILDAIAIYAGAGALTADQRTAFLKDYLKLTAEGGTVDQLNQWATTVLLSQVAITGTDTDNDNNSFVISSALAIALLSYLVSIGLLDAVPSIVVGAQITPNIRIGDKVIDPDVPSTDLTGILSIIKAILAALGGLPVLIATEVITALASSAFANGVTLNLDSMRSALGEIAQWDFADWSAALGAAMLLALKTFAIDLGLDGVSSALDQIAQWDFADWDKIFGSLDNLLPLVGINADIWDLTKSIAQWDFADWSSTLGSVLSGVLAAAGLDSLLGVLEDILNRLLGLDIDLDISSLLTALTDILNAILAIPGSIEAFFTIDQVAVEAAYVSLSTTFQNRFSGLNQLGVVFSYSPRTFAETPPVFTMKVPIFLKFAIEEEEMVIADLRPFKEYFDIVRNIISAILWVLFALWVLEQFDVKFRM